MQMVTASPPRRDFDVLVADDDTGVRELLADFLAEKGLGVATTPDGRAAVTALERAGQRCRLVFADIAMPGADGFAVLSAARQANPSCYVVMITGYGSLETAISAVRLGAQDYLTKPFSLGQVDIILRKANARRLHDDERAPVTRDAIATALGVIEARLTSIEGHVREITRKIG
jgi:DNA-binding NtrC family response regulator